MLYRYPRFDFLRRSTPPFNLVSIRRSPKCCAIVRQLNGKQPFTFRRNRVLLASNSFLDEIDALGSWVKFSKLFVLIRYPVVSRSYRRISGSSTDFVKSLTIILRGGISSERSALLKCENVNFIRSSLPLFLFILEYKLQGWLSW